MSVVRRDAHVLGASGTGYEVVEPALLHVCCFGIGMDVSLRIQRSLFIRGWKAAAVIPLFPEVAATVEHSVEPHRGIPV